MKYLVLILLSITQPLLWGATTLDSLIEHALQSHPSLESIVQKLEANRYNTSLSDQFEDPKIALTTNTLSTQEAMHQTLLTLQQKIPFYGKRDAKKNIALQKEYLTKLQLIAAKAALVAQIKQEAYTLWKIEEHIKITQNYIQLTKQNVELYASYTSIDASQHMGIMKAELSLSDLYVTLSGLKAQRQQTYARLAYLSNTDVTQLQLDLPMKNKPDLQTLQSGLQNNPDLAIKRQNSSLQHAKTELFSLQSYPDFNLIAGYAYRKEYDDYFNIGISLSLPVYGTQSYEEQESKALELSAHEAQKDTQKKIHNILKVYYAQMLSAYEIYHIVHDEALPQVAHMFELSSTSIATGGNLFQYIDILFQKLALEKKSIDAVASYYRSQALISQLSGELQ